MEKTELPSKDAAQPSLSRQKKITLLVSCAISMIILGMGYSMKSPFYPSLADEKGATPAASGFVLCIVDLVNFLISIPAGEKIFGLGTRNLLVLAFLLLGCSNLAFSAVPYIEGAKGFIAGSSLIRIVEACGHFLLYVDCVCMLTTVFGSDEGTVMSLVEFSFGVGLVIGPLVGGALVDAMDFSLPFWVLGGIMVFMIIPVYFFIPQLKHIGSTSERKTSIFQLLKIPKIWLGIFSIASSTWNLGFQGANLEPHLRPFELSDTAIGGIFSAFGMTYSIAALGFGKLVDVGFSSYVCILGGFCLQILGMGLTGPLAWIPVDPRIGLVIPGLMINGIGIAATIIPSMVFVREIVRERGIQLHVEMNGKISSVIESSLCLGGALGSSIGGVIVQKLGFRIGQFVSISFSFVMLILMNLFRVFKVLHIFKRNKKLTNKTHCTADKYQVQ